MFPALWWGLLAVIMFTLEVSTASFFFIWIGAGALLTALASFFVQPEWLQYLLFILSSIILVAVSRRWASKMSGKSIRLANVDSLVGRTGSVTRLLTDPCKAYATVDGESWRVETSDLKPLRVGERVHVKEVRSNLLIVEISRS